MVDYTSSSSSIPHWLQKLLLEKKFFKPCLVHKLVKKNEKNVFCLDCCTSFCLLCSSSHSHHHRLLQIRRYIYNDVIQLEDAEKLMNCSLIQTYTTNCAKVVFLKQRPVTRPFRVSTNFCTICDRSLKSPYMFCSLACKVQYLMKTENGTGNDHLYDCNVLEFPYDEKLSFESFVSKLEYGRMTPDSVLDSVENGRASSSGSSDSGGGVGGGGGGGGAVSCRGLAYTATTEFAKKKRSNNVTVPRASLQSTWPVCLKVTSGDCTNRRKGIPHRSPLC